jgi:hypothetical protein
MTLRSYTAFLLRRTNSLADCCCMTMSNRYCFKCHIQWLYLAANGCKTYLNLNLITHDTLQGHLVGNGVAGVLNRRPNRVENDGRYSDAPLTILYPRVQHTSD